jgi:hypothetical protein
MAVKRYNGTSWDTVAGLGTPGSAGIVTSATAPANTSVLWADTTVTTNNALIPAGGTTGQLLSKTSSSDYATTWSTVSTGSNFTLLNAGGTSLSGTTTTISGISGADKIFIYISPGSASSAYSNFDLRINADSGNNYTFAGLRNEPNSTYAKDEMSISHGANTNFIRLSTGSSNQDSTFAGTLLITGCNSTGVKIVESQFGANQNSGVLGGSAVLGGIYTGSSTVSSISILSTSSFDAGTIFVYTSA